MERKDRGARRRKVMRGFGHASIGIEMGLSVFIGYLIGSWLDEKLGTSWLTLTFLLLGVAAGFSSLFRLAAKLAREAAREEKGEGEGEEREGDE